MNAGETVSTGRAPERSKYIRVNAAATILGVPQAASTRWRVGMRSRSARVGKELVFDEAVPHQFVRHPERTLSEWFGTDEGLIGGGSDAATEASSDLPSAISPAKADRGLAEAVRLLVEGHPGRGNGSQRRTSGPKGTT